MNHLKKSKGLEAKYFFALMDAAILSVGFYSPSVFAEEATLPEVVVSDTKDKVRIAEKVSAGALGDRAAIDTPFSTRTVTSQEIEDRQATNLAEVIKYDASITSTGGAGTGTHPSTLSIRGIRVDDLQSYKVDGMANIKYGMELPLEMFERIDVLKGLSGFMYGFSNPGGVVNYVTKRPTDGFTFSADAGYSSINAYKQHVDLGGRFGGADEQRFGYRINVVHEEGGVSQESGAIRRKGIGLATDARLTNDLVLKFDLIAQHNHTVGGAEFNTTSAIGMPISTISGTKKLNSPGAYVDTNYTNATLGLDYQISQGWKNNVSYRYSDSVKDWIRDFYTLTDAAGGYKVNTSAGWRNYNFIQWQDTLQGKFNTGSWQHETVFGVTTQKFITRSTSTNPVSNSTTVYDNGVLPYSPDFFSSTILYPNSDVYTSNTVDQFSVFATDTIQFSPKWSVLAGVRYTDYTEKSYSTTPLTGTSILSAEYRMKPTTPTVALIFKPLSDITIYTSYAESLERTTAAPATAANANQSFSPTISTQTEIGTKTEQTNWNGSVAVFNVRRGADSYSSNGTTTGTYVADGLTRYQGLELNGSVRPTSRLTLDVSFMRLYAQLTQARINVGKRPVGVPDAQAAAQVTYLLPQVSGLSLRAGATYLGNMALDGANTNFLPSLTLYDAGLNYRTRLGGHLVNYGLNITNLADKKYWNFYQENALNVGAPRTVNMTVKFEL